MAARLPIKKANNDSIVAAIQKDRPVGPGHKSSDQYNALMRWLQKREKGNG